MKVVMLCDFFNEALAYQENILTKFYKKKGYEVTIIASTFESIFDFVSDRYDHNSVEKTYVANNVKIIRLPYRINFLNRVRLFRCLDGILEAEAPDLVFVHDIMFNLVDVVRYVKRYPRVQAIMDYHADYSNSGKNWLSLKILHGVLRKWVLDHSRPHLKRIFPVTPASARFLKEVYGVSSDEMELLPLGADLDLIREIQASSDRLMLREKYGIKDNDFVIFSGGKLSPVKRTEVLIESFLRLNQHGVHLVIVGDCAENDKDYLAHLKLLAVNSSRIHFAGWLENRDVISHISMADIAVFPASQSILWQQCIAMGLPLIIGEKRALSGADQDVSYLNLYENIIIASSHSPLTDQLVEIINRLINKPELRVCMAYGAKRVADEVLNLDIIINRTLQFTNDISFGSQATIS